MPFDELNSIMAMDNNIMATNDSVINQVIANDNVNEESAYNYPDKLNQAYSLLLNVNGNENPNDYLL